MKHKIAVVGGLGNMGKRYCAILKMLHIEHYVLDIVTTNPSSVTDDTTGIIIATPTEYHVKHLKYYAVYDKPILVEKPITKNKDELHEVLALPVPIRMINQYEYYVINRDPVKIESVGQELRSTYYNYFKTGGDSLYWDVINIIGLTTNGKVKIGDDSPIWDCWINGLKLDIAKMDEAYCWNIEDWVRKYDDNKAYIKKAHDRIFEIVKPQETFATLERSKGIEQ
jgi:hypothetical protein